MGISGVFSDGGEVVVMGRIAMRCGRVILFFICHLPHLERRCLKKQRKPLFFRYLQ